MKGRAVFNRCRNDCLSLLASSRVGDELPSENELSQSLAVSRTTIRAVLAGLEEAGIVARQGASRRLLRRPAEADRVPEPQTLSTSAAFERRFLEAILEGRIAAGRLLAASELARQFGTSTTTIREHLPHLQHFGLIERRPNGAWLFKGVTPAFAHEIYEVREMFELRAAGTLMALPEDAEAWMRLKAIEREHRALMDRLGEGYRRFPDLDERLHRTIHEASGNRFILDFYDIVSMLFHYNFRWDADDEKRRTLTALSEHLTYIEALLRRDAKAAREACLAHLRTGRSNLLRSISMRPEPAPPG